MPSSIKLVGDRHRLNRRQRVAVQRGACSDQARQRRTAHRVATTALVGQRLLEADIDNLINAGHPSELDPGPRRQAVRVRVALEWVDDAELIVAEFLSEEPG